jgi:hypothetical protein
MMDRSSAGNGESGTGAVVAGKRWYQTLRMAFAMLAAIAIITQFVILLDRGGRIGNFFSFFTIQSNIVAAVVLFLTGLAGVSGAGLPGWWDRLRGAATAYMATTGIVFLVLLSGISADLQLTEPWVDTVLHQVMPVVMVLDWLIDPPATRLTFRASAIWAVYPIAYCVYSLIRGPIVDWYPYPFLDPDEAGGYLGVAAYAIAIAILFFGLVWLVVRLGSVARAWWDSREGSPALQDAL